MLKNTYYLILVLSICASLLFGMNIGRRMQTQENTNKQAARSNTQEASPTAQAISDTPPLTTPAMVKEESTQSSKRIKNKLYTSAPCGISISYPDTVSVQESKTENVGAVFTGSSNTNEVVVVTCQKDIPKPPVPAELIENIQIDTVVASLYHDKSQKDGTDMDALIFTHPKLKLDIFIGGYGTLFNSMIKTIKLL